MALPAEKGKGSKCFVCLNHNQKCAKKVRERKMSSKADYLKKYLDSDKKRKKKKVKSRGNLTVKDTDVGWDDIKPASDDEFKPTIG